MRLKLIEEYGGKCACCGETEEAFLSIDHISGDGREHRKLIGTGGQAFYLWLKNHGYPKDNFQLLCMNCNFAKGKLGECPHQTKKQEAYNMCYINENGERYELVQKPEYKVWFVLRILGAQQIRFKNVHGSKDHAVAATRLNAYALKHGWVIYPSVLCTDCATRIGKRMAEGHIATWYPAICDACGELVTCTETRDFGHLNEQAELAAFHRIASGKKGVA
jgi:hypothetical protein